MISKIKTSDREQAAKSKSYNSTTWYLALKHHLLGHTVWFWLRLSHTVWRSTCGCGVSFHLPFSVTEELCFCSHKLVTSGRLFLNWSLCKHHSGSKISILTSAFSELVWGRRAEVPHNWGDQNVENAQYFLHVFISFVCHNIYVKVRNNIWESVISLHHMGFRDHIQTWQQMPLPAELSCQPNWIHLSF